MIQTKRVIIRVSALKFILFCLFLLFTPGCKCATDPQPADCDPGWHPCNNNPADCCMDTTSHSIDFWQIDTLGSPGTWSVLHDAAIIDENNVWAVGDISIIEEDGTWTRYNAAHWNGEEWELMQIAPPPSEQIGNIRAIYEYSNIDIWFSMGSLPVHYNGLNYYKYTPAIDNYPGGNVIYDIWGTSSDNIFFIGGNGSIVHYDGNEFTAMDSGTDVTLSSITGTGYDNVWVSGWVNSNGHYRTVLLHFDGNNWRKVVEMSPPFYTQEDSISGWIDGIYADSNDSVFVLTSKGLYKCSVVTNGEGMLITGSAEVFTSAMRSFGGTAENDLFSGGAFSRIIHYNGSTFYDYEELNNIGYIYGMAVSENMVVAVGIFTNTFRAMIIRGYR